MAAQPGLNSKSATVATFISTAVFVFAADLLTKWLAFRCLDARWPHVVIPGLLNISLGLNPRGVFGLGEGMRAFFILFTMAAAPAIGWAAWKYGRSSLFLTFGLGCVLGGAMGNLWDRLLLGSVRDFLDAHIGNHHWYTFNIADAAICVGAGILVLHSFRNSGKPNAAQKR